MCINILCTAIYKIEWLPVVNRHFVKLRNRKIAHKTPVFAKIKTFVNSTVTSNKQIIRIILAEGHGMVVRMLTSLF